MSITTKITKTILMVLSITLLNACTPKTIETTTQPTTSEASITCADERPQICTRDYRPVCGSRDTGIRCVTTPCPSTELKTYGNACTACADEKVTGYVAGECD